MGGSVSLPLTVEIAFAAGALDTGTLTWTDVTTYVRKDSISFNRGWDTESQEPIAGRASLSFNNESGNFTPGKTGAFGLIRNRLLSASSKAQPCCGPGWWSRGGSAGRTGCGPRST